MPRRGRRQKQKKKTRSNQNVPLPKTPQELEAVLLQMLAPNNEAIMQATTILKAFLRTQICVAPLVQQIQASSHVGARQMAGVLLRTRIAYLWSKLSTEVKTNVQGTLLQRLVDEESRLVRLSVAALISQAAKVAIPKGEWNSLLGHLLELSRSQNPAHREVSMVLFRALAENIPTTLQPHFSTLLKIFQAGLVDDVVSVSDEALKAIGILVELINPPIDAATTSPEDDQRFLNNIKMFSTVIPFLIQHTEKVLKRHDNEDSIGIIFSVLDDLAESPTNILGQYIATLLNIMGHILLNRQMAFTLREKASSFICQVVKSKPGQVTKHNLLQRLLDAAVAMGVEEYENSFEVGETTPQNLAVELLDALVFNMPKRLVYPYLMENVNKLVTSSNEHHRKGAFVVLAILAEGCTELILESGALQAMVQAACQGVRDPSAVVRAAACVALTQFAEGLKPEISSFHQVLVPSFFHTLDDPQETVLVKSKCCVALEVFIESLGEDSKQYTQPLMERLFKLLHSSEQVLQVAAVKTMKATALANTEVFQPFAQTILPMMASVMQNESKEMIRLRCAATECVGAIAISIGQGAFSERWLQGFLPLAIKGMSLEDFELREATYHFFAQLAMVLRQDFGPLLNTVMTFALATCISDDGLMANYDEIGGKGPDWEYSDSEPEDDDLLRRGATVSIRSGALDEKMAALNCISTVMEATGPKFFPFMERTLEVLDLLSEYTHHFIRSTATTCLHESLRLVAKAFPAQVSPGNPAYNPQAKPYLDKIIPLLILRLVEEDEKEVCAGAAEALTEAFGLFGVGCAGDKMNFIFTGVKAIIEQKAPCQPIEEDLDEKEIADHDEVLMDHTTDLISAMGKAIGPTFDEMFKLLFEPLLKFCAPDKPPYDRSMAIGLFAEVAEYLGPHLPKYIPHMVPVVFAGLKDKAIACRRNASFAAGTLIQHGKGHMVQHYGGLLDLLRAQLVPANVPSTDPRVACSDNACSAMAKLIMTNPTAIPLAQVIPVFLSGLPLRADMLECKYVYTCLLGLFRSQRELMNPHIPQVIAIISQVLGSPVEAVSTNLQKGLQQIVKGIASQMGDSFGQIVSSLPESDRNNLVKWLQSP